MRQASEAGTVDPLRVDRPVAVPGRDRVPDMEVCAVTGLLRGKNRAGGTRKQVSDKVEWCYRFGRYGPHDIYHSYFNVSVEKNTAYVSTNAAFVGDPSLLREMAQSLAEAADELEQRKK
jgi:hypothetical protein